MRIFLPIAFVFSAIGIAISSYDIHNFTEPPFPWNTTQAFLLNKSFDRAVGMRYRAIFFYTYNTTAQHLAKRVTRYATKDKTQAQMDAVFIGDKTEIWYNTKENSTRYCFKEPDHEYCCKNYDAPVVLIVSISAMAMCLLLSVSYITRRHK